MENIDNRLNYLRFYGGYLRSAKLDGKEIVARCPFHGGGNEKTPSWKANPDTGQWKCWGCDASGNAQTFLTRFLNIENPAALDILTKEAGIERDEKKKSELSKYTVAEYAFKKCLPLEFILSLGVRDTPKKDKIKIPYMDESGDTKTSRYRFGENAGRFKFAWVTGSKVDLYGLWRLTEIRQTGHVVLVEGESDSQTLWYNEYSALGSPGSTTFQAHWVDNIRGLVLYLYKEPEQSGESYLNKVCSALVAAHFEGELKVFSLPEHKDPSDLWIFCVKEAAGDFEKAKQSFKTAFDASIAGAQTVDWRAATINPEEIIPGAPVMLRPPQDYRINDNGVYYVNAQGMGKMIINIPLLFSKRLKSIDTQEEKIELIFKRDGQWHKLIAARSTVFQKKSICILSDRGLPVSSDNAEGVVRYLAKLEGDNMDTLQLVKSTEHMGWISDRYFLPGQASDILLDTENSQGLAGAYISTGDFKNWTKEVNNLRGNNIFRSVLACSFAAVLLRPLGHRVFIFHLWGNTRSGKTAALKTSLSVWGDPEGLMANFNATKVGLERLAAFYNDLPLGIDERQVAGPKQEFIENLVYLLGLGKGKARGAKGGGLQNFSSWRCLVITTGEEPLCQENSHGGIKSRVLEVYGAPFTNEEQARYFHGVTGMEHGFAGPFFVGELLRFMKENPGKLKEIYNDFLDRLHNTYNLWSHITASAVLCTADYLTSRWIFKEDHDKAIEGALLMGRSVLGLQQTSTEADTAVSAWDHIINWIVANEAKFQKNTTPPQYGWFSKGETDKGGPEVVFVFPYFLEQELEKAGYSPRRIIKDWTGRLVTRPGDRGAKITQFINGKTCRVYGLIIRGFSEQTDLFFDYATGSIISEPKNTNDSKNGNSQNNDSGKYQNESEILPDGDIF